MNAKIARHVYLIVRGEGDYKGKAPYEPVIVCSRLHTAKWEAGYTDVGSTVWESPDGLGWMLSRYKGYDVVSKRNFTLFDGKTVGEVSNEAETYLNNAVWWSYDLMPKWLEQKGVRLPTDSWTIDRIVDDHGTCEIKPISKMLLFEEKMQDYEYPDWIKEGCKAYKFK